MGDSSVWMKIAFFLCKIRSRTQGGIVYLFFKSNKEKANNS